MLHEYLSREELHGSSDRTFGLFFGLISLLAGLEPLRRGHDVRTWALVLAMLLIVVAIVRPSVLGPANSSWMKLGLILSKVFNPVMMALLFYVLVTPMAVVMRLLGKDPMRRAIEPQAATYWLKREEMSGGMRRQF